MWLDAKYLNPFFTRRLTQEVSESEKDAILPFSSDVARRAFGDKSKGNSSTVQSVPVELHLVT